jgi:hypothetical protein
VDPDRRPIAAQHMAATALSMQMWRESNRGVSAPGNGPAARLKETRNKYLRRRRHAVTANVNNPPHRKEEGGLPCQADIGRRL